MERFKAYVRYLLANYAWKAVALVAVVAAVVFGIIVLSLIGGSDYTTYPRAVADLWICEEPHMEIHCDDTGYEAYVEIDGSLHQVEIAVGRVVIDFYEPKQEESDFLYEEDVLLRCDWKLKNDKLILTILEDRLFDGAYTELVFNAVTS